MDGRGAILLQRPGVDACRLRLGRSATGLSHLL
jgi:hypothetical protein